MKYTPTHLRPAFKVNDIVTIHYFEYEKDYKYPGESHDFWEMTYVDKGEIEIDMGTVTRTLNQGSLAFHQPNEYHSLRANGVVAPNLIVISFICKSKSMDFFKNRVLSVNNIEKGLLSTIINEYSKCFSSPIEDTFTTKLQRRNDPEFGAEQMISLTLEHLLISLYRNSLGLSHNTLYNADSSHVNTLNSILQFMQNNIHRKITLEEISEVMNISKTGISNLFKENMNCGAIVYFTKEKMKLAKSMIREGNYNVSQIGLSLGYDSVHLFSRRFKQITGMSPTEYKKSVKVNFDNQPAL